MHNTDWCRVSPAHPCTVCGKADWCTFAADGSVACCMRVISATRMQNGGYLHRLSTDSPGTSAPSRPPVPVLRDENRLPPDRAGTLWAGWACQTDEGLLRSFATCLGVDPAALRAIGAAWAWPYDAWAFPMFDGLEQFRGIRLRSLAGDKWALAGSRQGIFLPDTPPPSDEACICEGPTDLAAILSLGLWGIGRPSCNGGAAEIAAFCRRTGIRRLSILADNDGPGLAGAARLADETRLRARIVTLPAKDVREAVRRGATRATVEACINNATWRN